MAEQTSYDHTDEELAAIESLMMLSGWRKSAQQLIPAGNEVLGSALSTPVETRNNSPTEANLVPNLSPEASEASRSDIKECGIEASGECVVNLSDHTYATNVVTDRLKNMISEALSKWKKETSGAENVPLATVAKIMGEIAFNAAIVEAGPSGSEQRASTASDALDSCDRNAESDSCRVGPSKPTRKYNNKENKQPSCVGPASKIKTEGSCELVGIGEGHAQVPAYLLRTINWDSYKGATRSLLEAVFGRKVLATQNLTGKPSPAFPGRAPKGKLDAAQVNDIIVTVVERCGVSVNMVRASITSKCADESKLFNHRKKSSSNTSDDT